jgi:hypothetical protein
MQMCHHIEIARTEHWRNWKRVLCQVCMFLSYHDMSVAIERKKENLMAMKVSMESGATRWNPRRQAVNYAVSHAARQAREQQELAAQTAVNEAAAAREREADAYRRSCADAQMAQRENALAQVAKEQAIFAAQAQAETLRLRQHAMQLQAQEQAVIEAQQQARAQAQANAKQIAADQAMARELQDQTERQAEAMIADGCSRLSQMAGPTPTPMTGLRTEAQRIAQIVQEPERRPMISPNQPELIDLTAEDDDGWETMSHVH